MVLPFNPPRVQVCPKCHWRSPYLQSSDAIMGGQNCPECGSKLKLVPAKELSLWDKIFRKLSG